MLKGIPAAYSSPRSHRPLAALLFVVALCSSALAEGVIQLPQTGQTKCYDPTTYAEISCNSSSAAGQDGYYRSGAEWPNPRFMNPDGTTPINGDIVFDRLTGLEWSRYADTPSYSICSGGEMTWPSALDYIVCLNALNYLGHNDWRLPDILEIASLPSDGKADSSAWLNAAGFSDWPPGKATNYWSSTTNVNDPFKAWAMVSWTAGIFSLDKSLPYAEVLPVRHPTGWFLARVIRLPQTGQKTCYNTGTNAATSCRNTSGQDGNIRAGVAWPNPRFTISNGTVIDNLTGLIWLQEADCANSEMAWTQAVNWAGNLHSGQCGLGDGSESGEWRLPNRVELLYIMDFGQADPAVPDTLGTGNAATPGDPFYDVRPADYLTSTTYSYYPQEVIASGAGDGTNAPLLRTEPAFAWPVFDNRKRLATSYSGNGVVVPNCSDGCWYPKNSTVSLTAIPSDGYAFAWWSSGCSGTSAVTSTTMDAPKTCTASFYSCAQPAIRNLQSGMTFTAAQGIQDAYDDSQTCALGRTDTLQLLTTNFAGQLIFNLNKNIILQGGWDCGYVSRWPTPSFVQGTMTVSNGSVVFDRIVIW